MCFGLWRMTLKLEKHFIFLSSFFKNRNKKFVFLEFMQTESVHKKACPAAISATEHAFLYAVSVKPAASVFCDSSSQRSCVFSQPRRSDTAALFGTPG